jgi:hypothetical protein
MEREKNGQSIARDAWHNWLQERVIIAGACARVYQVGNTAFDSNCKVGVALIL